MTCGSVVVRVVFYIGNMILGLESSISLPAMKTFNRSYFRGVIVYDSQISWLVVWVKFADRVYYRIVICVEGQLPGEP